MGAAFGSHSTLWIRPSLPGHPSHLKLSPVKSSMARIQGLLNGCCLWFVSGRGPRSSTGPRLLWHLLAPAQFLMGCHCLCSVTASKGLLDAAHFCYLVAQVTFGVYTKKSSKLVLIGSDHRYMWVTINLPFQYLLSLGSKILSFLNWKGSWRCMCQTTKYVIN